MNTYVIMRRGGWHSEDSLKATGALSLHVGDEEMSEDIRWIRSYVLPEEGGTLGTVCIYQATSPEKIREHAARSGMPATEVHQVAETIFIRPDPIAVAA